SVVRLTDPSFTSIRSSVSKHGFLVSASDVSGRFEAYRIDLKSGQQKQLTDAAALDPHSVQLLPDERSIVYIDGPSLMTTNLSSLKVREVYKTTDEFGRGVG